MEDNAVISSKKVASSVSQYVWDSPCLKPIVFNPFILSLVILICIWLLDFLYGKRFICGGAAMIVQQLLVTYTLIAGGIVMNNIIIKHHYRLERYKKSGAGDHSTPTYCIEKISSSTSSEGEGVEGSMEGSGIIGSTDTTDVSGVSSGWVPVDLQSSSLRS